MTSTSMTSEKDCVKFCEMTKVRVRITSLLLALIFFFSSTVAPVFALISYSYDADGNMVSDGQYCYTYNEANQISKVKNCSSGQVIAEYLYDFEGKRTVKKEYQNGSLKQTTYTPEKSFETKKQATDSSVLNTSYYYVNDELVARKNSDGSKVFYSNDHLNSTNILTDASGKLIEETTYYPYGDIRSGGTKSKYLYTGQEKDLETGLNYYGARYYNSHIARFTQADSMLPDPYDPQQLNRYAYTRNNPLKYTDPSGNLIQIPILLYAGGAYLTTVTSTPDFQYDLFAFNESVKDLRENPNVVNALMVGANIASMVLPGVSEGSAARTLLKGGDEVAEGGAKAVVKSGENIINSTAKIGSSGKYGELMQKMDVRGQSQIYFNAPGFKGGRFIDRLELYIDQGEVVGSIHEAKTGYTTLTQRVSTQIAKDKAILGANPWLKGGGVWDFYRSPLTGKTGYSKNLENVLRKADFLRPKN